MKSRWKSIQTFAPDREYVVLATSIPPMSRSSTLRLFKGASSVRKQLSSTAGVVGFSTMARPWQQQ
jgi:hypothetical protein